MCLDCCVITIFPITQMHDAYTHKHNYKHKNTFTDNTHTTHGHSHTHTLTHTHHYNKSFHYIIFLPGAHIWRIKAQLVETLQAKIPTLTFFDHDLLWPWPLILDQYYKIRLECKQIESHHCKNHKVATSVDFKYSLN